MKSKKILIILLIVVAISAVGFGIFRAKYNENYLYNNDGTIADGHKDLLEHLKNVQDKEEKEKQIKYALDNNLITQEEAEQLK